MGCSYLLVIVGIASQGSRLQPNGRILKPKLDTVRQNFTFSHACLFFLFVLHWYVEGVNQRILNVELQVAGQYPQHAGNTKFAGNAALHS